MSISVRVSRKFYGLGQKVRCPLCSKKKKRLEMARSWGNAQAKAGRISSSTRGFSGRKGCERGVKLASKMEESSI